MFAVVWSVGPRCASGIQSICEPRAVTTVALDENHYMIARRNVWGQNNGTDHPVLACWKITSSHLDKIAVGYCRKITSTVAQQERSQTQTCRFQTANRNTYRTCSAEKSHVRWCFRRSRTGSWPCYTRTDTWTGDSCRSILHCTSVATTTTTTTTTKLPSDDWTRSVCRSNTAL